MAPSSAVEHRKTERAFLWIAAVAILLAALLTVAWYVMASRLDVAVRAAIETAGGQGVRIGCAEQAVFGYPFRIGLRCDGLDVEAPAKGFRATGGKLRTAAQIYRPTTVVAELDGPLALAAEGAPPLDIRWDLAQASAHFWTEGLDRFSLVMDSPVVAMGDASTLRPLARSERLEFHARRREDSLDLAFLDRGIRMLEPAVSALPAFDASADLTIDDAGNWLSGERPGRTLGEALAGRAGTIRTLRIAMAGATPPAGGALPGSAELSGPFSVDADGRISGLFELALADPGAIAALVSTLSPEMGSLAASVASGIAFAGRTENGRTVIRIDVKDGRASLGFIPLGMCRRSAEAGGLYRKRARIAAPAGLIVGSAGNDVISRVRAVRVFIAVVLFIV